MRLRTYHTIVGSVAGFLLFLMILGDKYYDWLWTLMVVYGFFFVGGNVLFGFRNPHQVRERRLWDVSEFQANEEFTLDAAEEVFAAEPADGPLELKVKMAGQVRSLADKALSAPLSGRHCVAWSIEIEVFHKTKLGGDADYVPIIDKRVVQPLALENGKAHCRIEPPALLNAGFYREDFFLWENFPSQPALKALLDEGMAKSDVRAKDYQGVRVRETLLTAGEKVLVYGTMAKTSEGLVVRGNDILDDPDSLLIQADRAREKLRFLSRRSPLFWANVALTTLCVPVLLLALLDGPVGKSVPWLHDALNATHYGPVMVTPGGQDLSFDFYSADNPSPDTWTFAANEHDTAISLTSDKVDWSTAGSTVLKAYWKQSNDDTTVPGHASYPVWDKDHWVLDLTAHNTLAQDVGSLWIRNHLSKLIRFKFKSDTSDQDMTTYWNFKPKEGDTAKPGMRLTLGGDKGDLRLATGDQISVEADGKVVRSFGVGTSPEVVWSDTDDGWVLDITADTLKPHSGPVWVLAPPDRTVDLTLSSSLLDQLESLSLPPQAHPTLAAAVNAAGQKFTLDEGQELQIDVSVETLIYDGPLDACPWAVWDKGAWLLTPPTRGK